jgi:predicted nucleotidyltransferase
MYIDNMFEKYMDWKLIRIFLQTPDRGFYTKEIIRKTGLGAGTVNNFLHNTQKDNILIKEIIGNVHLYKLNNELEIIKHLKIVHTLMKLEDCDFIGQFLKLDETLSSIILYGSHANGENDSKSDIDLLLLVNKKRAYTNLLQKLEKKLNKQISLQQMTIAQWQKLKEQDKIFYESILEKHIVLYGSGLP